MIARRAAIYRNRAITQRRSVASMPIPDPIDIDDCTQVYGDIDPNTLTFEMDDLDVEGEGK